MWRLTILLVGLVCVSGKDLVGNWKSDIHHIAHNSDFVHQFYPMSQWWCSLENFWHELLKHDRGGLAYVTTMLLKGVVQDVHVYGKCANEGFRDTVTTPAQIRTASINEHDKTDINLVKARYIMYELGLLSTNREKYGMFHFKENDATTIANGIFHETLNTKTGMWNLGILRRSDFSGDPAPAEIVSAQVIDREFLAAVKAISLKLARDKPHIDQATYNKEFSTKVVDLWEKHIRRNCFKTNVPANGYQDQYFPRLAEKPAEVTLPDPRIPLRDPVLIEEPHEETHGVVAHPHVVVPLKPKTCTTLSWFPPALDPMSPPDLDRAANCPEIPAKSRVTAVLIEKFVRGIKGQNEYKYHDAFHSAAFATVAYMLMKKHTYDEHLAQAAAMGGLWHDYGYRLLPRWLYCAKICTPPQWREEWTRTHALHGAANDCSHADHKGHELASLIAVLHVFRAARLSFVDTFTAKKKLVETLAEEIKSLESQIEAKKKLLHGKSPEEVQADPALTTAIADLGVMTTSLPEKKTVESQHAADLKKLEEDSPYLDDATVKKMEDVMSHVIMPTKIVGSDPATNVQIEAVFWEANHKDLKVRKKEREDALARGEEVAEVADPKLPTVFHVDNPENKPAIDDFNTIMNRLLACFRDKRHFDPTSQDLKHFEPSDECKILNHLVDTDTGTDQWSCPPPQVAHGHDQGHHGGERQVAVQLAASHAAAEVITPKEVVTQVTTTDHQDTEEQKSPTVELEELDDLQELEEDIRRFLH